MRVSAEKTQAKRSELVERIADYLLEHGLQGLSLRQLAAALGTSDRMLLHYFITKEELVCAALDRVATRLLEATGKAVQRPRPIALVAKELGGLMRSPAMKPYFRLWIDLASVMAGGDTAYAAQAAAIAKAFHAWITHSIDATTPQRRKALAALSMAALDGCALFDSLGMGELSDAAMEGFATLSEQA